MNKVLAFITVILTVSPCYGALIHHYEFSIDASDSIGTANGTLYDDAHVSDGVLNLDGFGDYVQFDTHLVPTTGNYTVAFFGREHSRPELFGTMISQGWTTSTYSPPEGFYVGRGDVYLRATDFTNRNIPFPTQPHPSGFHHFAVVVDTTESLSRLFVDGRVVDTLDYALTSQALGTDTRFGRQFDSSAYTEYFHGTLDDIRIYDSVLTNTQITQLAGESYVVPIPAAVWLFGSSLVCLIGLFRS